MRRAPSAIVCDSRDSLATSSQRFWTNHNHDFFTCNTYSTDQTLRTPTRHLSLKKLHPTSMELLKPLLKLWLKLIQTAVAIARTTSSSVLWQHLPLKSMVRSLIWRTGTFWISRFPGSKGPVKKPAVTHRAIVKEHKITREEENQNKAGTQKVKQKRLN